MSDSHTIVLSADDHAFPVVFEMIGFTVIVQPWKHIKLVIRGAEEEALTIGHGADGVSVFRDEKLDVEVYDCDGNRLEIPNF